MRIIAGKWRGRPIAAPDALDTRPILDRVKTVLFDILGNRLALPGILPPLAVLDLFAGSGALGLEALSRGARYCLFVEQRRTVAEIIRRNLDSLEVVDEAAVRQADAMNLALSLPPPSADDADTPRAYELVFVDPPYQMLSRPRPDAHLGRLLERLATQPGIAANALIVVRHEAQSGIAPDLSPLIERERRIIGKMILRFMVRPDATSASPEASADPDSREAP